MSKISIVVPVYKVEQYLSRCVHSILSQSFRDFDLILVDDGSPDSCPVMCDSFAKEDERIVVIHKKNGGLSDARNTGIEWSLKNSDSHWITFIDSDDWVHRDYLELLYRSAIDSNVDIAITFHRAVASEQDVQADKMDGSQAFLLTAEECYCDYGKIIHSAWAKIYKKSIFEKIRYPKGRLHEDAFVTFQLLFEQKQIALYPMPLYYYYLSAGSITRSGFSIKRLTDRLDALNLQSAYFLESGYERALEIAMRQLVLELYSNSFDWKGGPSQRKVLSRAKLELLGNIKNSKYKKLYKILCKSAKAFIRKGLNKDVQTTRERKNAIYALLWGWKMKIKLLFLKV